jgi:hypothetical protein
VWFFDFPEHDPDSNYPEPSAKQLLYADQAQQELARLKEALERLTVPQQRAILAEVTGRVFKHESAAIEPKFPAHESEAQALTEASQTTE